MSKTLAQDAAKKIKMLVFDVDGVMTDGSVTYDENGVEYKTFNVKDGQGIVSITKAGIITAIITARNNGTVKHRFENLGMTRLFMGQKDKLVAMKQLLDDYNLDFSQVAYMGDDLPDYPVMKMVGLPVCPADASPEIKDISLYISNRNGGKGAVRDIIEQVLKAQDKWMKDFSCYIW